MGPGKAGLEEGPHHACSLLSDFLLSGDTAKLLQWCLSVYPAFLGVTGWDFLLTGIPHIHSACPCRALVPTKDPQLQRCWAPRCQCGLRDSEQALSLSLWRCQTPTRVLSAFQPRDTKEREQTWSWPCREVTCQAAAALDKAVRKPQQRRPGRQCKAFPLEA